MSEQMDFSGPEWDALRREMRQWWVRQRPDRSAEEDGVCECEELRAEVERLRAEVAELKARLEGGG